MPMKCKQSEVNKLGSFCFSSLPTGSLLDHVKLPEFYIILKIKRVPNTTVLTTDEVTSLCMEVSLT